jgi:alpha-glucosidase
MRGGVLFLASLVGAMVPLQPRSSNMDCPGYKATNVNQRGASLEADLTLAGDHCDSYGTDLENLKLLVEYQTGQCTSQIFSVDSPQLMYPR